jgi:broad-specificity NMP kinase
MSNDELKTLKDADLFGMLLSNRQQTEIIEQELHDRGYSDSEIKEEMEGLK